MQQQLGDDFDAANDVFKRAKIEGIDDAARTSQGVGAPEIDPAVLSKWQAKYPDAVLEADGELVKLNNQIKIHPDKLDEVDEATINKIVNSTQELDAVGGDITKVSPETKKAIENLTSTKGGRWRFEYQTNGIVNQYLDYVGLKEHSIFQNMSDAEKKRMFDIPNQMNNLDELPANAKQKKITAKAQEKMIEQQAASYAIQQNPKDAIEFVNHTEFYKAQMKQKIESLEKQYSIELKDAVNKIAIEEEIEPDIKKFTQKQIEKANKNASKAFFSQSYDEKTAFKSEKAAKKHFKETTYKNAETGNNFEQLKPQTRDEIQNAYLAKATKINGNVGGFQINPSLSPQQTIEQIQKKADNLKFGNESAAVYHTEKHYGEFPPSHKTGNNKFNNYWQSAIKTIKNTKSDNVISSYDQLTGSRSFVFQHIYEEGGDTYQLQTIVGVSQDVIVEIRTYFNF